MNEKIISKLYPLAGLLAKPLYLVGGTVRNSLLSQGGMTDADLSSPNTAEELVHALDRLGYNIDAVYKRTGTVLFKDDEGGHYEHTTFRSEKYAEGGGHTPLETAFTDDILRDAMRRDFKCNAVYYDILGGEYVDPLGGIADIAARRLDTVVPPQTVFRSDGLRLLRLCRFAGELGFAPTAEVLAGAREYCDNIKDISPERVYEELKRMLVADGKYDFSDKCGHYSSLKLACEIGVFPIILPELALGENMPQRQDFHKYDVLEHSLRTVLYADKSVRFAALLHDVGKPYAMLNRGAFAAHAEDGERLAAAILSRLKAPKAFSREVCRLVGAHMVDLDLNMREAKVRRFIAENYDIYEKILLLKQADYSACKDDLSTAATVVKWQNICAAMMKEGVPMNVGALKIGGEDLKKIGFTGREISLTLEKLWSEAVVDSRLNDRARLLAAAEKMYGR